MRRRSSEVAQRRWPAEQILLEPLVREPQHELITCQDGQPLGEIVVRNAALT